jgi:hypothetical protein
VVSPLMKTRRRSRRGAATLPARRWTGGTCRGRPRRRLPTPLKCHLRGGRRQSHATRMWARARDKQLALPDRTSGQSTLVWRPARQAPSSHREPRPAKVTPPPPRWSEERLAPIRQLFDGSDHLDSDSLQRHRSRAKSTDSASTLRRLQSLLIWGGGAPDVHISLVAGGGQGPTQVVAEVGRSAPERTGECIVPVEAADRSGAAPELAGSKRAALEQGSSGRPAKKSPMHSKM